MAIGTTAAIIGAGVLGAGASVAAANKNKKAISQSTDASLQANRESIAAQERIAEQQLAAQREALEKGLAFQTNALNQNMGLQANTFNSTGQMQADLYNQRVNILQPWAAGGGAAFNQINAMLGLPEQQFKAPKAVNFTPVAVPTVPTAPTDPAAPAAAPAGPSTIAELIRSDAYKALSTADRADARSAFYGRG